MTKFATIVGGVADVIYLYDPRPGVDAVEIPDEVFAGWVFDGTNWSPAPAEPPTFEDQVAEIEAEFESKKDALVAQLSIVQLFSGANEATKIAELKAAYNQAVSDRAAALDALLF